MKYLLTLLLLALAGCSTLSPRPNPATAPEPTEVVSPRSVVPINVHLQTVSLNPDLVGGSLHLAQAADRQGQNKIRRTPQSGKRRLGNYQTNVPVTATVCQSGCDYTPAQLATTAISQRVAGDVLELRAMTPGTHEEWGTRILCNGVSGTNGNEIILRTRQGDSITIQPQSGFGTPSAPVGNIDFTDCHYWWIDGQSDDSLGLEFGRLAYWQVDCARDGRPGRIFNCYPHLRSGVIRASSHIALYRLAVRGAGTGSGFFAFTLSGDSSFILVKHVIGSWHGANQGISPTTTSPVCNTGTCWEKNDSGDLFNVWSHHSAVVDSTFARGGHKLLKIWCVFCVSANNYVENYWGDIAQIAPRRSEGKGNHTLESTPGNKLQHDGSWTDPYPTTYGPVLIEGNEMVDSGSDGERSGGDFGGWNYSSEMHGVGLIFRDNYWYNKIMAANPQSSVAATCGFLAEAHLSANTNNNIKIYNNTILDHRGIFQLDTDSSLVAGADSGNCSQHLFRNNVVQGMYDGRTKSDNSIPWIKRTMSASAKGSWPNDWRGSIFDYNIFAGPGAHPQIQLIGNGGGTVSLSDCSRWPQNVCNNTIAQVLFANGTTNPIKSREGLQLSSSSPIGVGDAAPIATVTAVGTGNTFTINDPYVLTDDFGFGSYDWRGLYRKWGDCICVTATASGTAGACQVTRITDGGNPRTGPVTVTSAVTRVVGSKIWRATNNPDGSCGAVRSNRGALH